MSLLSVLYYPNFEPNPKWLRSVLLLVDEVVRIVPEEAEHADSPATRQLLDAMPGCLKRISPLPEDKSFDSLNFHRLQKAFRHIRDKNSGKPKKNFDLTIHQDGSVQMKGNAWLSNEKVEQRVRDLLFEYDLAADTTNPFTGLAPFKNAILANEEASGLIVSYIADRVSRRTGLDTMTDEPVAFAVRSLDALGISDKSLDREGEGALASAIAQFVVPASVERISSTDYAELRESFADVREAFQELVRVVASHAKLNRAQSGNVLELRLKTAIEDFQREWYLYRKSRFARRLKQWAPMCIGGLLTVPAALLSPILGFGTAAAGFAITVIEKSLTKDEGPYGQGKTFNLLCQLEKQILRKSDVKPLI